MTLPYLFFFPGVFSNEIPSPSDLQTSVWIWAIWHCTFPIIIAITHIIDPTLNRKTISSKSIRPVLALLAGGSTGFAIASAAAIWMLRARIMVLVTPGAHFTHDFSAIVAPAIVVSNLLRARSSE